MTNRGWWDGYFDETFVDIYRDFLTPERTEREIQGLREMVPLPPDAEVLDLACGWGRHSVELARSGWRPARGDLKILAVVDEETGGELGAQWLCRRHPDAARCDFLLNEGGGAVHAYRGRRYYPVCCAEKGVFRFRVVTTGAGFLNDGNTVRVVSEQAAAGAAQ